MMRGGCLCGAVRYEVDRTLGELGHCHCGMCQKFHGAPFGTYVEVEKVHFRITAGETALTTYRSSPGVQRTFCRHCGTPIQFLADESETIDLIAPTLDDAPDARLTYEIWASAKRGWLEADGPLESHETEPPRD